MSGLSDGAKALRLLTDQPAWTHRRVESLAFLPSGEARRRVSWDYTMPGELAIAVSERRVAVPIATLKKRPLKRLDVRDGSGAAVSVWGTADNGRLAEEALASGYEAFTGSAPDNPANDAIRAIVYASSLAEVAGSIDDLVQQKGSGDEADLGIAFRAVAETLADNFLLVVEMPVESIGERTLVKASYDDSREFTPGAGGVFTAREVITIDGQGWNEAGSWHLEVHAPDGVMIERLWFESWDAESLEIRDFQEEAMAVSTAHVTSTHLPRDLTSSARATLRPANPGLLNQVTIGAAIAFVLLLIARVNAEQLSNLILGSGQSGPLAALAFSMPAFFLALLARGSEHELVSRVLAAPRLASFASASILWTAGVCFLWRLSASDLGDWLAGLTVAQLTVTGWLVSMRIVGGRV